MWSLPCYYMATLCDRLHCIPGEGHPEEVSTWVSNHYATSCCYHIVVCACLWQLMLVCQVLVTHTPDHLEINRILSFNPLFPHSTSQGIKWHKTAVNSIVHLVNMVFFLIYCFITQISTERFTKWQHRSQIDSVFVYAGIEWCIVPLEYGSVSSSY